MLSIGIATLTTAFTCYLGALLLRHRRRQRDQQQQVERAEYLKARILQLVSEYREGAGHPDAPMTFQGAMTLAHRAIDTVLLSSSRWPSGILSMRIAVDLDDEFRGRVPPIVDALTVRCIGARDAAGQNVYYVRARCDSLGTAVATVMHLQAKAGVSVRDWDFVGGPAAE